MAKHSLKTWIALLSESGFHLSLRRGSVHGIESAARRLDTPLDPDDRSTLEQLVDYLSQTHDQKVRFAITVFHHPMVVIPHRPLNRSTTAGVFAHESLDLPPWGRMEEDLEASYTEAVIPIDWMPEDGSNPTPDAWDGWMKKLTGEIAELIWPIYDANSGTWERPYSQALIDADFDLLQQLRQNLDLPISARFPTTVFHSTFFAEEDDGNIQFCTGYDRYDPTLEPLVLKSLPTVFTAGIADKVGTLDLQLKRAFQRPRPHQVALIQERNRYSYKWANTANSPSLVAGHSLQSALGGCTVNAVLSMSGEARKVFQQFTADVGDRRVFAGVHYPSDSLASWYAAFRLIPRVFRGTDADGAKDFLWEAIGKSLVFGAVMEHAKDEDSPYARIVGAIEKLAKGPASSDAGTRLG